MERESNPMEALCRSGCGFYGNPSTDGLCSVCFKEALKKKQQPPSTTPSAVSAPFVASTPIPAPAPAPTPLAAAVPTVPMLPAAVQAHTESKCPKKSVQKSLIMENDPTKKESKGKRILKKALRRNSKSSNNSSLNSDSGASAGVTRSKSYEKASPADVEEARAPQRLQLPPGQEGLAPDAHSAQRKSVDFQADVAAVSVNSVNSVLDTFAVPATSKKSLKRKLEEDSGAGTSGASAGASDTDADDKDPSKDKKKKNRCAICRKKVGLTGFECRCGGLFCAVHRYSDKHQCSFDYRELGAQEIRRNNPVVVSQKIHKI